MQKRVFISFGGPASNYHNRVHSIGEQAKSTSWFTDVHTFTEADLIKDSEFWGVNGEFMSKHCRGFGYWLWKPYIIYKTLQSLNDDDILVYADAGCTINISGSKRFEEYIQLLNDSPFGLVCFQLGGCQEKVYTKNAVFQHFQPTESQIESDQIMATVCLIRKTSFSKALVQEWFLTSSMHHLINDERGNEKSEFKDHRHDQSIFSMTVKKYSDVPYLPSPIKLADETYFAPNWQDGKDFPFLATRIRN